MNGKSLVKQATTAELELRARLAALVDGIPDGPEQIKRLSKNTCVVSLSTIKDNNFILCPSYYMSGTAKERLKQLFLETPFKSLDRKIKTILETGWISEPNKNRIRVCPEFQAALEKLWYGNEQEVA